jgi:c-di-GMP-binding flagellar brake protein YcgR
MRAQAWHGEDIDNAIRAFVDRRRKRRVQVSVSIIVRGLDRFGNRYEEATQSINFSAGGTCFFLKQRIRVGTTVALGITLPTDSKTYNTIGQVTRVEAGQGVLGFKYGVRFAHKHRSRGIQWK